MIKTKRGHVWLNFHNGYTISIFNGFGSYSDNYNNFELIKSHCDIDINSSNCEIAILYNNEFVTKDILNYEDDVKGYVTVDELADIIKQVKDLK